MFVFFHAHISRAPTYTQIFHIIQINAFESRLFPSSIFFFSHMQAFYSHFLYPHTLHIFQKVRVRILDLIYFFFITHFITTYIPHKFFFFLKHEFDSQIFLFSLFIFFLQKHLYIFIAFTLYTNPIHD